MLIVFSFIVIGLILCMQLYSMHIYKKIIKGELDLEIKNYNIYSQKSRKEKKRMFAPKNYIRRYFNMKAAIAVISYIIALFVLFFGVLDKLVEGNQGYNVIIYILSILGALLVILDKITEISKDCTILEINVVEKYDNR